MKFAAGITLITLMKLSSEYSIAERLSSFIMKCL